MSYPSYPDKYLVDVADSITGLDHSGEEARKWKGKISHNCIITYQWEILQYLLDKFKGQTLKLDAWTLWGAEAYYTSEMVFVYMKGVGSPHAVMMFEELIILGIKNFINIGTAGGLKNTGFFVCTKAIRDEGTSFHYIEPSEYAYPNSELTEKLENSFKKLDITYEKGISWTIDAPMRETLTEVKHYKEQGVLTVEMEASALFAVAKVRSVYIAAAFFTSDVVGENNENFYITQPKYLQDGLEKLSDVAVDCLSNLSK